MKNYEKYKEKIDKRDNPQCYVYYELMGNKNCKSEGCSSGCFIKTIKWLLEEYKEPIQLSHDEYVALKNLGSEFKFIARDKEENCLSAYTSKPYKGNVDWWLTGGVWCELLEHLFPFIKWEDEEPYEIAKLIEDYKKENGDVSK